MSKTQTQGAVVLLLLVVLSLVWFFNRGPASEPGQINPAAARVPEQAAAPEPASAPAPQAASSTEPVALARDYFQLPPSLQQKLEEQRQIEEQERLSREQQRTGISPASGPSAVELAQQFHLQGIFWGTAKPQAVINRKILTVGDEIDEAEVTSITKERVILSFHGQEIALTPDRRTEQGSIH